MKYYYEIILFFLFFLLAQAGFSQLTGTGKMYIPSGGGYFKVMEIHEWSNDDTRNYFGKYEYIYPAYDEFGEWAGDGVSDEMSVTFTNDSVYITTKMRVEGWDEPESTVRLFHYPTDFLKNFGKFVKLNYIDSSNRIITTKGVLTLGNSGNNYEDFYEKSPDAGHNAFFLFNKPMHFNYNIDEFQATFPEFLFSEKDKAGSTVYKYSNLNNKSGQCLIEVLFNQNSVKEVRLTGQLTEEFTEFDKIRFSIQNEFFYKKDTRIEDTYISFYEKNDLKAEINWGDPINVTISQK